MKKIVTGILAVCCLLQTFTLTAQEKKVLRGFDGGMMVHTGYLSGQLDAIGYEAKGAPLGIGGVIRLHLGEHFRVGGEGYVSTLSQRSNGSYLKYGDASDVGAAGFRLGVHRRDILPQAGIHGHRSLPRL